MLHSIPFNSAAKLLDVGTASGIKNKSGDKQEKNYFLQVRAVVANEDIIQYLTEGFY